MQVSAASSNADKNWWKDAGYLNANDNSSVLDSIYDSGSNHSLMGKLSSKGHGHFVKFAFESTTAEITDLQLKDRNGFVDVVTSIKIENFEPTEAISRGSIMAVGNETVGMVVHDNPTGMVRITVVNSSADISYLFPEGVRVSRTSEISSGSPFNSVLLSGDAKSAVLASNNGTMTVEQVENGTYVNVTVEDGVAVLRFKPLFSHNPAFEEAVLVGIYGGRDIHRCKGRQRRLRSDALR
jgi:hypothetical protein